MGEHVITKYGVTVDLSRAGKCRCPKCSKEGSDRSGDNLMVYGLDKDGQHKGAYCWACTYTIPSEKWLEEHGEQTEEEYGVVGSEFNAEIHEKFKAVTTTDSGGWRGIRSEITAYFGVRHEYDTETGELKTQWYPCTIEYHLSGYKRRGIPKDFKDPMGETGQDCELFGQFRFRNSNSRDVLVVGGEVDQLSAFQMIKDHYDKKGGEYEPVPVVSATIGESGAHKQLQKQYGWLDRFDRILLCLDNDKAGKEAIDKIAKVLPRKKLFVVNMGLKDPNEYLKQGREKEFMGCYWKAKAYVPSGIIGSNALIEKIKQNALVPKIPLPPFMYKLQRLMAGGIPLGRIVNIGSMSGAGKSTFCEELVYFWIFNSPHRIGIVSLEADAGQYGTQLLSRHVGRKIDLIETPEEKVEFLERADIAEASEHLFSYEDGAPRFYLVHDRDGGIDVLKSQVEQLVVECDCKVIIIDPLQDVLDGLPNEEQAVFMRWQKGLVKSHNVTFININHVRKSGQGSKANSTGADLHEEDLQGSSAIFKSGACNLLFTRNKEAENELEKNTTIMKMTKCRWTGQTSPVAGKFLYVNSEHRLYDFDDYLQQHPELYALLPEAA